MLRPIGSKILLGSEILYIKNKQKLQGCSALVAKHASFPFAREGPRAVHASTLMQTVLHGGVGSGVAHDRVVLHVWNL